MTTEEDPMPQRGAHHHWAGACYMSSIYAHDESFKLFHLGHQAFMDCSDSGMTSDDQSSLAGGAMCVEPDDVDLDMDDHLPTMDQDSDGVSDAVNSESGLLTKYWNLFDKHEELQAQLLEKEQELRTLKGTIDATPFACVLIDGDGAVFLEKYINRGEEGGKIAGDMLYHGIRNYLRADSELCHLGITNIMVQVYLNVEGLGRALQSAGLLSSQHTDPARHLTLFGRGFNRAQMLFSFVDVGREKEAADHKIRAVFELMERNLHCKCLILAGCHDGGYGRLLDTYEYKYRFEAPWHKIRLLETTPTPEKSVYRTPQYLDAFPRLSLPEVFRSDPVVTATYSGNSLLLPRATPCLQWYSPEHFTPQRTPSSGSLYNLPVVAETMATTRPSQALLAPETNRCPATGDSDIISRLLSSLEDTAPGGVITISGKDDDHSARPADLFSLSNHSARDSSEPVNYPTTPSHYSPSSLAQSSTPITLTPSSISAFNSQPNTILPPRALFPRDLIPSMSSSPFPRSIRSISSLNTTAHSSVVPKRHILNQPSPYPCSLTSRQEQTIQQFDQPYERVYYLNEALQRVDSPINPKPAALQLLKDLGSRITIGPGTGLAGISSSKDQPRFCNKWHIYGFCPASGTQGTVGCKYIHGPRLTGDLLTAVRYNARNLKCGKMWECRDFDCHMGHHCFNPAGCRWPTCKFVDGHGALVSLERVWKIYPDGREERIDGSVPEGNDIYLT